MTNYHPLSTAKRPRPRFSNTAGLIPPTGPISEAFPSRTSSHCHTCPANSVRFTYPAISVRFREAKDHHYLFGWLRSRRRRVSLFTSVTEGGLRVRVRVCVCYGMAVVWEIGEWDAAQEGEGGRSFLVQWPDDPSWVWRRGFCLLLNMSEWMNDLVYYWVMYCYHDVWKKRLYLLIK